MCETCYWAVLILLSYLESRLDESRKREMQEKNIILIGP